MPTVDFSTFCAISELFVTAGVVYLVVSNIRTGLFHSRLALGIVLFEFFVNMLYMISRMDHHAVSDSSIAFKIFAAVHGSMSLLVFVAFVVLALLAHMDSRRGKAYFREHKRTTWVFLVFWMLSVLSGEILYFIK